MGKEPDRRGLRAGSEAPDFTVRSLRRGEITLADYRWKRVLLVFADPTCPECDALMPWLQEFHELRQKKVSVLMLSRGAPAATWARVEQFGLTFDIGLQRHWEVSQAYRMVATPAAYAIGEKGKTEAEPAVSRTSVIEIAAWMGARG